MRTAVVIGCTGLVGRILVEKLAQDRLWTNILAISRRPVTWANPKIRGLVFDFKGWPELELQIQSFSRQQPCDFFCALGTTMAQAKSQEAFKKIDKEAVIRFAQAATNCRAEKLLIVSGMGANSASSIFYNRIKGEMEAGARQVFSGFLRIVRPSLLLGDREEFRFSERLAIMAAPLLSPIFFGKLVGYKPIPAVSVAAAMIGLTDPSRSNSDVIENAELLRLNRK